MRKYQANEGQALVEYLLLLLVILGMVTALSQNGFKFFDLLASDLAVVLSEDQLNTAVCGEESSTGGGGAGQLCAVGDFKN